MSYPLVPLKHLAEVNPEVLPEASDPDLAFDYIDIGNVVAGRGINGHERLTFGEAPSRARRILRAGDVLVSTVRTYLRAVGQVPDRYSGQICSTGFAALRPQNIDPGFLGYAVASTPFVDEVVARSVGVSYPAITPFSLAEVPLPSPSLERQRAVADFLDRECNRIAAAIDRLAAISSESIAAHHAATGERLLDRGAERIRLRHLTGTPQNGSWGSEPGSDEVDLPCVRVADFDRSTLRFATEGAIRSFNRREARKLSLTPTDLVLEKSGGGATSPVGFVVGCGKQQAGVMCSNFVARIRPREGVDSKWLLHVFAALYARGMNGPFVRQVTGIQNLDTSAYLNLTVPLLSLEDQVVVGREVQASLELALRVDAETRTLRDRLAEYRDALITEATTGMLDVTAVSEAQMDERANAAAERAVGG